MKIILSVLAYLACGLCIFVVALRTDKNAATTDRDDLRMAFLACFLAWPICLAGIMLPHILDRFTDWVIAFGKKAP